MKKFWRKIKKSKRILKMLKKTITQISSDIIRSVEKSSRKVIKIPNLDFSKIKERILESFIESINKNRKIENPS